MAPQQEEIVLVTGCSAGGIGHALALELAGRAGFHVVATSRSLSTLDDSLRSHPHVETLALDVSSLDSISRAVSSIIEKHGRIDILINNAGVACVAPVVELPLSILESTFKTNVYGPIALIQAVVPHMVKARKGKVINVGSLAGFVSGPWSGGYCASKFALHALTDSLRLELKPFNVQVVLVAPGVVTSNFGERSAGVFKGVSLRIYKPYEAALNKRIRLSQQSTATPTAEFARKTIDAVLRRNPPGCFIYGYLSAVFTLLYYLPLWMRDWYLSRTMGVHQSSIEDTVEKIKS